MYVIAVRKVQSADKCHLQTLGASLACSPISLVLYIGEKMCRWSAPDSALSIDFVIANCMLYWFTGKITSSFWLYYLIRSGDGSHSEAVQSTKLQQPVGFTCGHKELCWVR